MKRALIPFNLGLLKLTPAHLKLMEQVDSLDLFEGATGQFNDRGLFSIRIFGRPGEEKRSLSYGYITTKLSVLHPVIYSNLIKLKALYGDIISGSRYAIFNNKTKDFEPADILTGDTGFAFFMSKYMDLVPAKGDSPVRNERIKVLEKWRKEAVNESWVVIPAGIRELDFDSDGRTRMDEINDLYQRLLGVTQTIPDRVSKDEEHYHDRSRLRTQQIINEIYEYIKAIISPKRGWIQQRFASRRIFNSTRGVLTSRELSAPDLLAPNRPGFMDCTVGVYQHTKAVLPVTIHCLSKSILADIFDNEIGKVELVNKKTLELETVEIDSKIYDKWTSRKGLEAFIESCSVKERRHKPIEVANHYLALVYRDNSNFRIFRNIQDLPKHLDRKNVYPITYIELLYLAGFDRWNDYYAIFTRYPVTGLGSTVDVKPYVKTTIPARMKTQLDENWEPIEGSVALEFPEFADDPSKTQYFDTLAVPASMLEGLGGDFDGDTGSYTAAYTEEALTEAKRFLNTWEAYLTPEGKLAYSAGVHTVELAVRNISGPAITKDRRNAS